MIEDHSRSGRLIQPKEATRESDPESRDAGPMTRMPYALRKVIAWERSVGKVFSDLAGTFTGKSHKASASETVVQIVVSPGGE
jgi:hypothetical protein